MRHQGSDKPASVQPLVFTQKGIGSYIAGALALLFGAGVFWLAMLRPGEANSWVPWVVGAMFASLGLFTLLSRTRVIFDPVSATWADRWGILFFEFSNQGSFEQLEKIRIEESEGRYGSVTPYIWVLGRPGVKIMVDIANDSAEATRIAEQLQALLNLPVERVRN